MCTQLKNSNFGIVRKCSVEIVFFLYRDFDLVRIFPIRPEFIISVINQASHLNLLKIWYNVIII